MPSTGNRDFYFCLVHRQDHGIWSNAISQTPSRLYLASLQQDVHGQKAKPIPTGTITSHDLNSFCLHRNFCGALVWHLPTTNYWCKSTWKGQEELLLAFRPGGENSHPAVAEWRLNALQLWQTSRVLQKADSRGKHWARRRVFGETLCSVFTQGIFQKTW